MRPAQVCAEVSRLGMNVHTKNNERTIQAQLALTF